MRVLRSLLFVPGNSWRMIERACQEKEDAVILDLEDAVPIAEKETARWFIKDGTPALKWSSIEVFVRVNGLSTGLTSEDLQFVIQKGLDGIVLPKTENRQEILRLERMIAKEERNKRIKSGTVTIIPLIETARGVFNIREIAAASKRVIALAFGAADYLRDMGRSYMTMSSEETEILYPRALISLASRVAGIVPIDTPYFGLIIDEKGLAKETMMAAQLGFKGKLVIHPSHIEPVNRIFTPSSDEIASSKKVIHAYQDATRRGLGAASLEGRMIDYATYEMAKEQLSFVENIERKEKSRA